MSLYELDPAWPDEHVATLYFPDVEFVMQDCPYGSRGCYGESEWVGPTDVSPPVARAQLRYSVDISEMVW